MCVADNVSHRYDEQQQILTRDQKEKPDKWERGIRGRGTARAKLEGGELERSLW